MNSYDLQNSQTEQTQITECPNCSGNGGFIDDDSEEGWQVCGFCDGKALVTFNDNPDDDVIPFDGSFSEDYYQELWSE